MSMQAKIWILGIAVAAGSALVDSAGAQDRETVIRGHLRALETPARGDIRQVLQEFDSKRFSKRFLSSTTEAERFRLLREVKEAAADAGGVTVDAENDTMILGLRGPKSVRVELKFESKPPYGIDSFRLLPQDETPTPKLDRKNLARVFGDLERQGFTGVVYVKLDGKVVLKQAYGKANPELDAPTQLNTIFGIGSTPIDFTIAAICLLAQQDKLRFEDQIGEFFEKVPADKQGITIAHLLQGKSGLPDFHHTSEDWDADLAWIDRETAVQRILGQTLRFAPGADRAHSHAAFGLLAAIVERVSGQNYFDFLKTNFFDPAGMSRTGMNGDRLGCELNDFAVGGGPSLVGLPNIPPNWGPTSWLVLGSGGMCSTLEDLIHFYAYVRSGKVLQSDYARRFRGSQANLDGSDRGFEKFHCYHGNKHEAMVITNASLQERNLRPLFRGLSQMVESGN